MDLTNLGGVRDADISSPFSLPSQGVEVVWNHNLRWRGVAVDRFEGLAAPTRITGNFTLVLFEDKIAFPYGAPAETFDGKRVDHIVSGRAIGWGLADKYLPPYARHALTGWLADY